jgi:hypothetical protein
MSRRSRTDTSRPDTSRGVVQAMGWPDAYTDGSQTLELSSGAQHSQARTSSLGVSDHRIIYAYAGARC